MRESAQLSLYKLLIQAADTLSLILQNICELSYPLSPGVLVTECARSPKNGGEGVQ